MKSATFTVTAIFATTNAFVVQQPLSKTINAGGSLSARGSISAFEPTPWLSLPFSSSSAASTPLVRMNMSADTDDDEIERLRSMAAKLRAEASALEVSSSCMSFDIILQCPSVGIGSFDTTMDTLTRSFKNTCF
jgi:hypothetical protein